MGTILEKIKLTTLKANPERSRAFDVAMVEIMTAAKKGKSSVAIAYEEDTYLDSIAQYFTYEGFQVQRGNLSNLLIKW